MLLLLISRARHCTVYCFSHCNKTFVILALLVSIVHVSNSAYRPESKNRKRNESLEDVQRVRASRFCVGVTNSPQQMVLLSPVRDLL